MTGGMEWRDEAQPTTHDGAAWARYWELRAVMYEREADALRARIAADLADPSPLPGRNASVEMYRRHLVESVEWAERCRGYAREQAAYPASAA